MSALTRRARSKLFHLWFLLSRPMTLGVRVIVHDRAGGRVMLVRHGYVPGWHLPGGGVETGQDCEAAAIREVREETGLALTERPRLIGLFHNHRTSRRDHVALYAASQFTEGKRSATEFEIVEARFWPLDDLPEGVTGSTKARLDEWRHNRPPPIVW